MKVLEIGALGLILGDGAESRTARLRQSDTMVSLTVVGGSLTVWHGHDHACFGLLPPGLGSLGSPLGTCPLGTVTVALTNEMIHVWTVQGAPSRFGELADEWVETNVGS